MKKIVMGIAFLAGMLSFMACSEIDIQSPPGPDGKDAYQVWVAAVDDGQIEWTQGTDLANYFKYLKGEQGEPGASAYITWKAYISTGTVPNPHNPNVLWPSSEDSESDFYRFLTGAAGEDGLTPTINDNGNWEIGGEDLGVRAKADSVYIGDNGYWYINGDSTNVRATGDSAYEIWVTEVDGGRITDVNGNVWDRDYITLQDFWNYLQGKLPDGTDPLIIPEKTTLEYVSKVKNDTTMVCVFQTDSAAIVTMNYEGTTVTATADENGVCTIEFPRDPDKDITAVVTATAPDKSISDPISVRIPQAPIDYVMDIFFDQTEWYSDEQPVDSSRDYGYYDGEVVFEEDTIPYLKLNHYVLPNQERTYVKIPFTTSANITKVTIAQVSGISQFLVFVEPVALDDYSSGYLIIKQVAISTQYTNDTYITVTGWTDMNQPIIRMSLCGMIYYHVVTPTP